MGTALARTHAETDLAARAASYGMVAWAVDGMDVEAVAEATMRAVAQIRGGGGACFLELRTYRFRAHAMYDPDRYRDKAEIGAEIEAAITAADQAELEPVADLTRFVTSEANRTGGPW